MPSPTSSVSANNLSSTDIEKNTDRSCDPVDPKGSDESYCVHLDPHEHPQRLSLFRKWLAVITISSASLCVTCASSVVYGVAETFHVSNVVTVLAISLFVEGLGVGPLLVGLYPRFMDATSCTECPMACSSCSHGRFAFSPNIVVYLVFRFITGFCGSAFLSVAGGSVSDLFSDSTVANPMALYTISPFIGPVVGPLLSGHLNSWRWTYYIQLMWIFTEMFVPETYEPVLTKFKAKRIRMATGDSRYISPLESEAKHLAHAIAISCYRPFQLLLFDRMALLLDTWNALILGILYLAFQAFPVIFQEVHGFNMQSTGMSFLGIGVGMLLAISTQPYWNRFYRRESRKNGGTLPPEARLFMGEIGGVLVPWIVPIIASVPFGTGICFVFISTFTYLVTAYRPIAASAMASNSAMRSSFAAAFPLFARPMYHKLGTVGATALLAGLTTIMAPLPFVFRRIGHKLRQRSRFAVKS
ncbi:major facilitator superfamily domain-containing protein [Cyathus striatus]|nr:major facilitator superfamily domain-containing protein [Cyathus striatus]